jgi:MFS family permease
VAGFALFAERRYQWNGHAVGVREVGYIFAFNGFIGIIMQGGLVGRLVKWFGERRMVQVGFVSTVVGYAALGFTNTIGQLLWVLGLASIAGAGLRPALTSLITQRAGRREQGVIIGLTQSLTSIAQIAAPIVGGMLIGRALLTTWAVWAGLLGGLALIFQVDFSKPR